MKLSKLIQKFYCSEHTGIDLDLEFGRYVYGIQDIPLNPLANADVMRRSKEYILSTYGKELKALKKEASVLTLSGISVENDIYTAGNTIDSDGVTRIYFPCYGNPIGSHALSTDIRYLLLAFFSSDLVLRFNQNPTVIITGVYPDTNVQGFVDPGMWKTLLSMVKSIVQNNKVRPGLHCLGCEKSRSCKNFVEYADVYDCKAERVRDKGVWAFRLYTELVQIRSSKKYYEQKEQEASEQLSKCAEGSCIKMLGQVALKLQEKTYTSYPFTPVYRALNNAGYWDDAMARIIVGRISETYKDLPFNLQQELDRLKIKSTRDTTVLEVIDEAKESVQTSIFRGLC